MKKPNLMVLFVVLSVFLCEFQLHAQSKDCPDIIVKVNTISPENGQSTGSIEFIFDSAQNNGSLTQGYKIFLINDGPETARDPVKDSKIKNLKAGFYDIVIVDNKGCTKQMTVTLHDK